MKKEDFETVKHWLTEVATSKTGSGKTEAEYLRRLPEFCEWCKMNPDQLIAEAEKQIAAGTKEGRKWAENLARKYFSYLTTEYKNPETGQPLARTTAKSRYSIIRSFFVYNEVPFYGKVPKATTLTTVRVMDKSVFVKIFEAADLHRKGCIVVLNDTGMRPEDAIALTYGDVSASWEEPRLYIEKVGQKEDVWFAVCIGARGTEVIKEIFAKRRREGEEIIPQSPILTRRNEPGKSITTNMLYREIVDAGSEVGVKLMPKMFRKRFRTECSPIIGTDATKKMGGWKIPGVGESYYLPPQKKTIELYQLVEPTLTLARHVPDENVKAQREIAAKMLQAAGFDPELLLRKAKVKGLRDEAEYMIREVGKLIRERRIEPEAGGLAATQQIGRLLAEGLKLAIRQLKEDA